jgi:hypothetical protein
VDGGGGRGDVIERARLKVESIQSRQIELARIGDAGPQFLDAEPPSLSGYLHWADGTVLSLRTALTAEEMGLYRTLIGKIRERVEMEYARVTPGEGAT